MKAVAIASVSWTGPAEPPPEPPGLGGPGLIRGPALNTAVFFFTWK